MMGVLTLPIGTSILSDATFACPDLTTFARLDELGLEVTGQRVDPDRVVLACRVVDPDQWCCRCGCQGVPRDTVSRRLAHEPLGWRPATGLSPAEWRGFEGFSMSVAGLEGGDSSVIG